MEHIGAADGAGIGDDESGEAEFILEKGIVEPAWAEQGVPSSEL